MSAGFFSAFRSRTNLLRMAGHGAWLFGDRALRGVLGLVVSAVVARHLGPESFGALTLAFAYVMLFASVAQIGLDGAVIRDLSRDAGVRNGIMGTAYILKLAAVAAVFVLGNLMVRVLGAGPEGFALLVGAASFALFFYTFDVIDFYFQSQLNGRAIAIARSSALVVASGTRITLVAVGAPLAWFAAILTVEAAIAALLLVAFYVVRAGSPLEWKFEGARARDLVVTSLPVALSGFFVMGIMQVDKLMLENMAGTHALGIYAAATLLSAAWYLLPVVVGSAVVPTLTRLHESNRADYATRLQDVYAGLTAVTLCVGTLLALVARPLVLVIFGADYADAAIILAIHLWTGVFVAHVAIRTWALLIEGRVGLMSIFSGLTLVANVLLNLALIDRYGGIGAACAALISWGLNALAFPLFYPASRAHAAMLLRSFVPASWLRALAG